MRVEASLHAVLPARVNREKNLSAQSQLHGKVQQSPASEASKLPPESEDDAHANLPDINSIAHPSSSMITKIGPPRGVPRTEGSVKKRARKSKATEAIAEPPRSPPPTPASGSPDEGLHAAEGRATDAARAAKQRAAEIQRETEAQGVAEQHEAEAQRVAKQREVEGERVHDQHAAEPQRRKVLRSPLSFPFSPIFAIFTDAAHPCA
ncbi:hypothetical protein BJ138DRAFT_1120944 [Hygrophoropsis aurantiaca]|uniref:Uncharacterized protein n=1 Tax=Hygrophoropsis aurantiaca TaxID=72124 RepID=A0ACB7ZP24_9AGAM|nr:hypothetical protein BJ138DRAFT_1120944 [Hygrophoropsis aurantiaca]